MTLSLIDCQPVSDLLISASSQHFRAVVDTSDLSDNYWKDDETWHYKQEDKEKDIKSDLQTVSDTVDYT